VRDSTPKLGSFPSNAIAPGPAGRGPAVSFAVKPPIAVEGPALSRFGSGIGDGYRRRSPAAFFFGTGRASEDPGMTRAG